MPLTPWKRVTSEVVFTNRWWRYCKDIVDLPSGNRGEYHFVHSYGSSLIAPVLEDERILLVRQYRYLGARESLEFPCGAVKEGATHDQTAVLELAEETGYSARTLLHAGSFNPYNGVTNELCHVYIARDLHHVGGTPDETEEFEIVHLTREEIDKLILEGTIWDGMSIAAWFLVRQHLHSS
jgi:8-oxo-dGTP pyrophosphatase MutT (NUDIX family)